MTILSCNAVFVSQIAGCPILIVTCTLLFFLLSIFAVFSFSFVSLLISIGVNIVSLVIKFVYAFASIVRMGFHCKSKTSVCEIVMKYSTIFSKFVFKTSGASRCVSMSRYSLNSSKHTKICQPKSVNDFFSVFLKLQVVVGRAFLIPSAANHDFRIIKE